MYIFNMWEIVIAISVLIIAIFVVAISLVLIILFKNIRNSLELLNTQILELTKRLTPVTENLNQSSEKLKEIVIHIDETVESVNEVFEPLKENKEYAYKGLFIGLLSTIGVNAIKNFISKKFSKEKEV